MSSVTKGIIEGLVSGAVGSYVGSKMVTQATIKVNNIDIPLSQLKAVLDAINGNTININNVDIPISQLKALLNNLDTPISQLKSSLDTINNNVAKSSQLPSSLTSNGNLKIALTEDLINLINTLNTLAKSSQLPSSLTSNGNLKVALIEDLIGLINAIKNPMFNAYNVITIDLGTANTDTLIASNVIYLKILSASTGATYSIKLFSTTNDALDQTILPQGAEITGIDNANVYLTNTAQTGATLKILVFRRV